MADSMRDRIGCLLAHQQRLRLHRIGCNRESDVDLLAIATRYFFDLTLADMALRGRCTGCGEKGRNRVIVLG